MNRRLKVAAFAVSVCMPISMGGLAPAANGTESRTVTRTTANADTRSTSAYQWPHDMPRPSLKKRAKRLNRAQRTIGGVHGKLRHKKPRHTKRYKRRLARQLRKSHSRQRFGWFGCSVSVAQFIMSNGFAPAKLYRVVKNFKSYFGSAKATLKAAATAYKERDWSLFIAAAGDEGPEVIQAFFGAGDLMDQCF